MGHGSEVKSGYAHASAMYLTPLHIHISLMFYKVSFTVTTITTSANFSKISTILNVILKLP